MGNNCLTDVTGLQSLRMLYSRAHDENKIKIPWSFLAGVFVFLHKLMLIIISKTVPSLPSQKNLVKHVIKGN